MTEVQLKTRVGLLLIISHFVTILLIVILYLPGGFLFEEMTTIIALIIPMFSVYTTAIIKYIIDSKHQTETHSKPVTWAYIFIAFAIPSLFVLFLIAIILMKAFNLGFTSFEQLKIMIAVSQIIFGTYIGLVISSMFDINQSKSQKTADGATK